MLVGGLPPADELRWRRSGVTAVTPAARLLTRWSDVAALLAFGDQLADPPLAAPHQLRRRQLGSLGDMTWWSVLVEVEATDVDEGALDGLLDALADAGGAVAGAGGAWSVRVSIDIDDAGEAAVAARDLVVAAAGRVGLSAERVVRLEAVRQDLLARELRS